MEEIRCSVCGAVVAPGDSFCQNCGSPVTTPAPTEGSAAAPGGSAGGTEAVQPGNTGTYSAAPETETLQQDTTVLSGNPYSIQEDGSQTTAQTAGGYDSAMGSAVYQQNTGTSGAYQMPGAGGVQGAYGTYDSSYAQTAAEPEKKPGKALGIVGLIMGIIGLVSSCCFGGFIFGLVGLVLSIICLAKKGSKGLGISGLIASALSFIISLIWLFICLFSYDSVEDNLPDEYNEIIQDIVSEDTTDDFYSTTEDTDYDDYDDNDDYDEPASVTSVREIMINNDVYSLPASLQELNLTVNEYSNEEVTNIETNGLAPGEYEFVALDRLYSDGSVDYSFWAYIENTGSDTVYSVDQLQVTGINVDNYTDICYGAWWGEVYNGIYINMSKASVEATIGTRDDYDGDGDMDVYYLDGDNVVLRLEYDEDDYVCAIDLTVY